MNDAVAGAHHLLGSCLRDPETGRQGRIVGIDQTRAEPALLVNWQTGGGVERVTLARAELEALVAACLAREVEARGASPGEPSDKASGEPGTEARTESLPPLGDSRRLAGGGR